MKKYNNYKDSGIEWIGKIPEHWDIILFKRIILKIKDGTHGTFQRVSNGHPFLSAKNVYDNGIKIGEKESNISEEDYLEITKNGFPSKNDLLITCVGTIGRTYVYDFEKPMAFQRSVTFIRFYDGINPQFYKYYVQSSIYQNLLISLAKTSAQSGIYMGDLMNTTTIKIPPFEQTAIANYLDHKTAQIDTLIAKKEKFISLLQEERTAVINQAVTKGLDPNVPMKDSGIEWLGEIPEHWEVKRMKYVIKTPLKYGANESAEDEILEDPRYIRITDFGNDGKLRKNTFKSLSLDKAENFLLEEGDILFARSGATVGKTFFFKDYKGVACFAGYLIKASCDPMIMKSEFLYEFTNSSGYENWKQSIFQQSTIQNIGADKYNQLKIGVPPIAEQQKIIDFITSKINEIDTLISKSQQEIELLKEYKTALISEVVTGKVDVRDVILN